jgi:UDP-glucose 4-epimerase
MKERVLITGASGFVGYHIIEEALKNNLEVYAAVRKNSDTDHLRNLNIQYVHLKYNDVESLIKEISEKKYDYIVHAAGVTNGRSQKELVTVNTYFTYNLAKAAEECGIKKFVLISSLAAIGPLKKLNGIITENTAPAPITAYGKSKLMAEQKVATLTALNYTILRPTAVFGQRDKGIFIFIRQMTKGLEPYIGNIEQKISLIYVKDLAAASIKAIFAPAKTIYNISDGNFYNRYELGDTIKELLKLRTFKFHLPVNFVKIVAGLNGKLSSLRGKASVINTEKIAELTAKNWHCDIAKAQAELGFYPRYSLHNGLTETLAWYKENKWL